MTAGEVELFIKQQGVNPNNFFIADEHYSIPTKKWVLGDFAEALKSFYDAFGTLGYQLESNDCDDFARSSALFAQILSHKSSRKKRSITVGEFWYTTRTGSGHAILCAIVGSGNKKELIFIEPQILPNDFKARQVRLTEEEKWLCQYLRF